MEDGTSGSRTESGVSCLKLDPLYCYGHSTLQTVFGLQRSSVWKKLIIGPFESQVNLSGRVRDAAGKALLQKQLGDVSGSHLGPSFDVKTGTIRQKKQKKEKTPEETAIAALKILEKKFLVFFTLAVFSQIDAVFECLPTPFSFPIHVSSLHFADLT